MAQLFPGAPARLLLLLAAGSPSLVRAASTTLGVSSASAMAGISGSSPNALAIIVPIVFASFLLLSLAACCCAYRRKGASQQAAYEMRSASKSSSARSRYEVADGLGILPTSHSSTVRYQHVPLSPAWGEVPPPYTPRSVSPLLGSATSPFPRSPSLHSVPSIHIESPQGERSPMISAPSPLISRTGSPSLQIWSPASSPSLPV